MRMSPLALGVGTAALASFLPADASAEFFADSKADLELRNFYFNRNFVDPAYTATVEAGLDDITRAAGVSQGEWNHLDVLCFPISLFPPNVSCRG